MCEPAGSLKTIHNTIRDKKKKKKINSMKIYLNDQAFKKNLPKTMMISDLILIPIY